MKYAEEIFPMGSFPRQQTPGLYLDATLAANMDVFAEKIVDDMSFLILVTGHDSVGNGKSTLASNVGCYLTWKINQLHHVKNTFTSRNMVLSSRELPQRSLELPKYSVIVGDESDDLTLHSMKELAFVLRSYFRKCRQLNQILILILPSFFEFPKFYALNRSHCLIDVKFEGKFQRGFFSFYSMKKKKLLYLKGKRDWDYDCVKPEFQGRFFSSYTFFPNLKEHTELYRQNKYSDMLEEHSSVKIDHHLIQRDLLFKRLQQLGETEEDIAKYLNSKGEKITQQAVSHAILQTTKTKSSNNNLIEGEEIDNG